MFEESLNREDDQHTKRLIKRFEQMISQDNFVYFDSVFTVRYDRYLNFGSDRSATSEYSCTPY